MVGGCIQSKREGQSPILARPGFDGGSVSWRIACSRKGDRTTWPNHQSTRSALRDLDR